MTTERNKAPYSVQNWTWEQVAAIPADRSRLVIVSLVARPGARIVATALEHRHFPPETPAGEQLQVLVLPWPDGEHLMVLTCPITALPQAEAIGREFGIRLVPALPHVAYHPRRPHVVAMLSSSNPEALLPPGWRLERCPIPLGPNVRGLENDPHSIVYRPGGAQDLQREEEWLIEQELEASYRRRGLVWDRDQVYNRIRAAGDDQGPGGPG